MLKIENVSLGDLDEITGIETTCFPKEQAASKESLRERLQVFPEHFLLAELEKKPVGYIGGMVSNEKYITDVMYEVARLHDKEGKYQLIFSLAVLPEYQGKGIARFLMENMIDKASQEGREAVSLTCRENLIEFYEKLGFKNHGISVSNHGNVAWYNMVREF